MSSDVELYIRVREREGRFYSDDFVASLPMTPPDHPLRSEWEVRACSCARLVSYLRQFNTPRILELGCGNGWLSNQLANCKNTFVVGLDRESPELAQAQRVFTKENLRFVSADMGAPPFPDSAFDVVVIASAIQYFQDLPRLMRRLTPLLSRNGEIHILDSPFYEVHELPAARERSRRYYERLGVPEMASRYHHHALRVLEPFHVEWLHVPRRGTVPDSPFPWLRLRPDH